MQTKNSILLSLGDQKESRMRTFESSLKPVLIITFFIFIIELFVIAFLHFAFPYIHWLFDDVLSATLLILLLSPALYYFMFKPLAHHIVYREHAEAALQHLNRELRAISICNQVLIRAGDEQTLLKEICRVICEEAGYRLAWVGYAENDEAKTIHPAAWAGFDKGFIENANFSWSEDNEHGSGPTGMVIRSGEVIYTQDFATDPRITPWRENALRHGYRSGIALPLKDETENTFGVLNIYSTKPNAFTQDERQLLEELAGDLAFGIVSLRNFTERKQAKDALQEERRLFIGGPNVAFKWKAAEGWPVEYVSPNIIDQFGYIPEDFLSGKVVYANIVHPDDLMRVDEEVKTYSEKQVNCFDQEYRIARADGEYRWVYDFTVVIRNSNGVITHYHGYINDITERKLAEENSRKAHQLIETIFEHTHMMLAYLDPKFNFIKVNPAYAKADGRDPSFYPGKNHFVLYPNPENEAIFKRVVETGKAHFELAKPFEYAEHLERGVSYWDWSLIPIRDLTGTATGLILTLLNVTDRISREQAMHRLNRELQALSNCNQALLRINDEHTLVKEICRIVCDEAGYRMASVGYAENDIAKKVRFIAWAGVEDGYLSIADITWGDSERGHGPTGTAIRIGETVYVQDFMTDPRMIPWRADALDRGYHSSIGIPLKDVNSKVFGAFTVYSAEPNAFNPKEIRLLEELTNDLAFGIIALRTRIENKQAQERLSKQKEFLQKTIESLSHPFYVIDANDYSIKMANTAANLGVLLETSTCYALTHRLDKPCSGNGNLCPLDVIKQTGRPATVEHIHYDNDGHKRNVEVHGYPILDESGNIIQMIEYALDITERKLVEEELNKNRLLLQSILDNSVTPIYIIDLEGKFQLINKRLESLLGIPREQIIGKSWDLIMPKEIAEGHRANDLEVIKALSPITFEESNDESDGRHTYLSIKFPIFNTSGGIAAVGGISTDITQRKHAEEMLRTLSQAIEQSPASIIITDAKGNIEYVNPKFVQLTGYTSDETIGKNPRILKSGEKSPEEYKDLWDTITSGKVWHGEFHNKKKNGELYWENAIISPIINELGEIEHIIAVKEDITEKKKLEQQFLRAQRMESLGILAGGIAHDLNNVLSPIMLSIDVLRKRVSDETGKRILETIESSAMRGSDIVKQVLTFGRGVEGEHIIIQPKHLINEMVKIAKETFPKSIEITTDVPRNLWSLMADPTQIHQVLLNICVNARDAMPQGGKLTIKAENVVIDELSKCMAKNVKAGQYVTISITDTGVGMSSEIMARIFEPFFSTKEIGKGTGLGLSTTHTIVKNHQGFIHVESEVGKGTTFKVYLPASIKYDASLEVGKRIELPSGHGETILVIDDESAVRELSRSTLESFGYKVLVAPNGVEGLTIYAEKKNEISVVLIDMMMPIMGGYATIQVLKKINPNVHIIPTSGLFSEIETVKSLIPDLKYFLIKPYTVEKMLETLDNAIVEQKNKF